jgi:acyl dehydratase/catechol 2,3-dioxygenase-like lactoylglutathione lyase family enzyme
MIPKSYVEHVAIYVKDIHWHIRFFKEVLGMECREIDGTPENPKQYWTIGGIQFMSKPDFDAPEGRFGHLGIFCEDMEFALQKAKAFGVREDYRGRNWIHLPDGLFLELMQAKGNAVAKVQAIDPRKDDDRAAKIQKGMPNDHDKYWDDVEIGDECVSPEMQVTSEMIMTYADLTGDFTPVHTDEAYAQTTPFGTRVAHGLLGLSVADGLKTTSNLRFVPGMSLGWEWKFVAPLQMNDTVRVKFRVGAKRLSKSRAGWGIVILPTELINQHHQIVQSGEHRLLIPLRPTLIKS